MTRPPRRTKRKHARRSRDGMRQTIVVLAMGAVLAVGLFAAGKYATTSAPTPAAITVMAAAKAEAKGAAATPPGDDPIYTGSILYMPDAGRNCRELLFDNRTGEFTDNGYVDCLRATYGPVGGTPMQMSAARLHVISSGFRQHEVP